LPEVSDDDDVIDFLKFGIQHGSNLSM